MKNSLYLGVVALGLVLVYPVQAAFVGDFVFGTGNQSGGPNIFTADPVEVTNENLEFSGEIAGTYDPFREFGEPSDTTAYISFDLSDYGFGAFLRLNVFRTSGGTFSITDLSVLLSSMDSLLPGKVLTGITPSPLDPGDPYFADPLQGLVPVPIVNDHSLEFTFTDFLVLDESRSIEFELLLGDAAPVVPVPPASLLVLLGMGGIVLKRRFA